MRAMRTGMKTTLASMLALGVCVWVGETRADGLAGNDDIALDQSLGSADLQSLNVGHLTVQSASSHVTQDGNVEGNSVDGNSGQITTGPAVNTNFASQGIVMQAANSGINSLIQQTATINVIFAPQN
jgi:hypothetical protein